MTGGIHRRDLIVAGAGLLALAGCGGGTGAGGDGSLRFAWWGNDVRAKLTAEAVALFEERDPERQVATEPGDFSAYFDRLAVQVAGRDAPDVFQMNEWNLREYADRGALLDLSEHGFSTQGWAPGSNGTGQVADQVFGATCGIGLQAVMVNPEVFEQAGIDVPDDTSWTWDQFHEVASELTAKTPDGSYGASYGASDQITFAYFLGQLGSELFADGMTAFDGEVATQWFDYWQGMVDDHTLPAASVVIEQSGLSLEQQLFSQGKVGMQVIPANTVVQSESTIGHDLTLLRIPTQTGKATDLGMWYRASQLFCASAGTKDPELATGLINFLLNDKEAGAILLADRGVPPNVDVRTAVADKMTPGDLRVIDYQLSCEPDLVPAPEPPPVGAGAYPKVLGRHAQTVLVGEASAEQAGSALVTELQQGMA